MERWMRLRGFEPDTATDGMEAVEKCRLNRYEIIVMDVEMPRMDGIEAIQVIKREGCHAPIIVLTGFVHDLERLRGISVEVVLAKPIRMQELENAIRNIIATAC